MAHGRDFPPDRDLDPNPEISRAAWAFRIVANPARLQALVLLEGGARDGVRLAADLGLAGPNRLYSLVEPLLRAGMISGRKEGGRSFFRLTATGARLLEAFRLASGAGPVLFPDAADRPGPGDPRSSPSQPRPAEAGAAGTISAVSLLGHGAEPIRLRLLLSLSVEGGAIASLAGGLGRTARVIRSHVDALHPAGLVWARGQGNRCIAGLTEIGLGFVLVLRAACTRLDLQEHDPAAGLRILDPTSIDGLAGLLRVFADPVRLRLINLLAGEGGLCSCHLLDALDLPRRSIYESVSALKKAGVLVEVAEERWATFRLARYARDLHRNLVGYLGPRLAEAEIFREDRARFRSLLPCPGTPPEAGGRSGGLPGRIRLA